MAFLNRAKFQGTRTASTTTPGGRASLEPERRRSNASMGKGKLVMREPEVLSVKAASRMMNLYQNSMMKNTSHRRMRNMGQTMGSNQASPRHEALRSGTPRRASHSERQG